MTESALRRIAATEEKSQSRPKISVQHTEVDMNVPHCGFVHTPADLLRLDSDRLQCKGCGKPFPSMPANEQQ